MLDKPEVLETHAEWHAGDIADASQWTTVLTSAHIDELEAALAHAKKKSEELLDITREDFPLDTLVPLLADLEEELINGRGFALIRGLPVERYSDDDASMIYWGIGMHLGKPWPQNKSGHLLGDVKDQGKAPYDPTARGNEMGSVGLPYHSDGSDLVGLLCLRKAKSGGTSTVANAVAVHNTMVRERPDLAAELYNPIVYDYRGEEAEGAKPFYFMPVFTRHGDRLFVRYIRPFIQSAMRHEEAPRLSKATLQAMDMADSLCQDPDYNVFMDLEPGDMQFVNNYHVLHGRRPYVDYDEPEKKRHLKRLWLETSKFESRPEYLAVRNRHWWSKGPTRA